MIIEEVLDYCDIPHAPFKPGDVDFCYTYEGWFKNKHPMIASAQVLTSYCSASNYYYHYMTPYGIVSQKFINAPRFILTAAGPDQLKKFCAELLPALEAESDHTVKVQGLSYLDLEKLGDWRKGKTLLNTRTEALVNVDTLLAMKGQEYADIRYKFNKLTKRVRLISRDLSEVSQKEFLTLLDNWKQVKQYRNDNYKKVGLTSRVPLASGMYATCVSNPKAIGTGIYHEGELVGLVQGFVDRYNRGYLATSIAYSEDPGLAKVSLGLCLPVIFSELCKSKGIKIYNFGDYNNMNNFIRRTKDAIRSKIIPYYELTIKR